LLWLAMEVVMLEKKGECSGVIGGARGDIDEKREKNG